MIKQIVAAGLATLAITANAAPIAFFNSTFDTSALAIAEGTLDGPYIKTSPPDLVPLASDAVAVGTTDLAIADAFADSGFLSTSASATAFTSFGNGVASSHFSGSFTNIGTLNLTIGFDSIGSASGSGVADGTLFVKLTSGGTNLINKLLTASDTLRFHSDSLPYGSSTILDLLLVSNVSADGTLGGVNDAFNLGLATFSGTVPLPATWLLMVAGIGALGAARMRARQPGKCCQEA